MLEGPGGAIEWLHWHPKGDVILAGTDEFTVWLWNAQTGACMQVQLPSNAQRGFFCCLCGDAFSASFQMFRVLLKCRSCPEGLMPPSADCQ